MAKKKESEPESSDRNSVRRYLAEIGRKGGKKKSEAKTAAARRAGALGAAARWGKAKRTRKPNTKKSGK